MKRLLILSAMVAMSSAAYAEHVNGYTRSNGTTVSGYERSDANNTVTDNYSFKGNSNPYTGATGTNPYQHDTTSPNYNGTADSNGHIGHSTGSNLFGQSE